MKVKITEYRGYEILFDTEKETFLFALDDNEDNTKKLFGAVKREIDAYIKENKTFKPFVVEEFTDYGGFGKQFKIIGVRKDGGIVYEDKNGDPQRMSKYDARNMVLRKSDNAEIKDKISQLSKQIEKLKNERNEILKGVTKVYLQDHLKELIGA